jgi:hypothetical protein
MRPFSRLFLPLVALLAPGHYRLEVHNFAGPPGNEVAIALTFFDSDGNPGT